MSFWALKVSRRGYYANTARNSNTNDKEEGYVTFFYVFTMGVLYLNSGRCKGLYNKYKYPVKRL